MDAQEGWPPRQASWSGDTQSAVVMFTPHPWRKESGQNKGICSCLLHMQSISCQPGIQYYDNSFKSSPGSKSDSIQWCRKTKTKKDLLYCWWQGIIPACTLALLGLPYYVPVFSHEKKFSRVASVQRRMGDVFSRAAPNPQLEAKPSLDQLM